MPPVATAADLLLAHDRRAIGDLVRDDSSQATYDETLVDQVVEAALNYAHAMVLSKLQVAGRYSEADLHAVEARSALIWVEVELAYGYIKSRRCGGDQTDGEKRAMSFLDDLAAGKAVLPTAAPVAGRKSVAWMHPLSERWVNSWTAQFPVAYGSLADPPTIGR